MRWTDRPKEKDVLAYLVEYLEAFRILYTRNVHVRLVAKKEIQAGAELVRYRPVKLRDSQKGKPDLSIYLPNALTVFVETKGKKGKLSEDQLRWKKRAEKLGFTYFSPFNFRDANRLIDYVNARL